MRVMKRIRLLASYILVSLMTASCTENISDRLPATDSSLPITMSSVYPVSGATTRATDNGFVDGDAVGVFIVDYTAEGNPGEPMLMGNRASNVKFAFDGGAWNANHQLYWADKSTPADFYGYYPFDESVSSVTDHVFAVSRQQDSEASTTSASGYEKSDLMWSKTEKVMPTTETVEMVYRHLMAGVTVELEMGSGFTSEEWARLDKTVMVESTLLSGSVNLKTGKVSVGQGEAEAIIPLRHNTAWRALVFPQTVAKGKPLISVTVNGHPYPLVKDADFTYHSGKMHRFTLTVNQSAAAGDYTFELKSEAIVAWIDDPELHDGLVRQYTIVKVEEAGKLQQVMESMHLDYERLKALKIEGNIDSRDIEYMRKHLTKLTDLNFAQVRIKNSETGKDEDRLDVGIRTLRHFVFPEKGIKTIAGGSFSYTPLQGTMMLPEGIECIENYAFGEGARFRGECKLPSTLKYLYDELGWSEFSGELHLPEGIKEVCGISGNFSGSLHFPASLEKVTGSWGYRSMTGNLTIPQCMTEIPFGMFHDGGFSHVTFHDGITEIQGEAFAGSSLSGELVLPQNLKRLGRSSFAKTKINKIIFPDALRIMDDGIYDFSGIFENCVYLTGTLELPKNVARIPIGCFYDCYGITGLVISENTEIIGEKAFYGCNGIGSIVCENPEPPAVGKDAFYGVDKANFTVEVPKGSVEKYKNAPGWSDFKRIAEYSNFVCRPAHANALNTAHAETLILNADGTWQVKHQPEWVMLSATSGKGKTELRMTFKEMAKGAGNRRDSILFNMPEEGYETYCVVSQYDYEHDEDSYLTLQTHSKGRGIDILFLGDGYDGEDISNGNYLNTVKAQMESFFAIEPYKTMRDYFNVHAAFPLSQEKGVNTMYTYVNNRFGTLYGYDGGICTSNQLLIESDEVINYVKEHTPMKQNLDRGLIIVTPNSPDYDGVTYFAEAPIALCPPSGRPYPQDLRGVIQHEAGGHAFGKLGDETIIESKWAPAKVKGEIEEKHGWGWYQNLSTTSKLSSVPWSDFVFDPRYSDFVDVYEGGATYMRGIFRPEVNSCMNYGIPYYNAPSRLSIMRRIFDYAGEPFSMEFFYANDSKEWGDTNQTKSGGKQSAGLAYTGSNTHRPPMHINAKEMGNKVRQMRTNLKNKRVR